MHIACTLPVAGERPIRSDEFELKPADPDLSRRKVFGVVLEVDAFVGAGSAPRGVGAKLAVSGDGEMAGSVSGGCVENSVVETALEVLQTGRPQLVKFGVSDEDAWEVGLACGGEIEVFVEPLIRQGQRRGAA